MARDPMGLAIGVTQVGLRIIGQGDAADMLGDIAGVPRRTPETVAYEQFVAEVESRLAALRRTAESSHRSQSEEIVAAVEQVHVRFEGFLQGTPSAVDLAHLQPDEFRARIRDASALERSQLGGVGPQVYDDALAIVTDAFVAFAPHLPQFATAMLTTIANGVADVRNGVGRLEVNNAHMEEKLDLIAASLPQASARTGSIRTGTLPGRAPNFVDTGILDRLAEAVAQGGQATLMSVTGLRGVGKTQVAAEFARRCVADGWSVVAWVNAESRQSVITDLSVLANEVVGFREGEPHQALLARWRAAWNSDPDLRRLVVLDNVTDAAHIQQMLPDIGAATVITTTSDAAAVISRQKLDVASWTPDQAASYLAVRTGLNEPDAARRVAEEVGFLPLALAQASWVIAQRRRRARGYGFAEYLGDLDALPLDRVLTIERGGEYPLKTAQAIELSVQTTLDACEDHGLGLGVLGVLAQLSPVGVPVAWLDSLDDGAGGLNGVLDVMEDSALVTPSEDGANLVMHRLVGRLLRSRPGTIWDEVADVVADVLMTVRPLTATGFWERRASAALLHKHVLAVIGQLAKGDAAERLVRIGLRCGHALNVVHLSQTSSVLHERLTTAAEQVLGLHHPDTLASRNNLASAYESVGDLRRAIPLFERTLGDSERVLGLEHPDTLVSRNNLAGAYESVGDLGRAIPLYEQALADSERVLGPHHPHTLISRNNLAFTYQAAGDLSRAILLYEQVLSDRERSLGPDNPSTVISRNNLAGAYEIIGNLDRAVPLHERAYSDSERILGRDHPDTLTSRNNLAGALYSAGDTDRAVRLYEQALTDSERVVGTDHPRSLVARHNLAFAYQSSGDLDRAIPMLEQVHISTERVLGPDHPDALTSRHNLAGAYAAVGDFGRAIPMFERTHMDMERVLGPDHPRVLVSQHNLASAYESSGERSRAIPLYEQALAGIERVLGPDHPDAFTSREGLALALSAAAQNTRALALATTNWSQSVGRYGPTDSRTLDRHDTIGYIQAASGDFSSAIATWHSVHSTALKHLGPDHVFTRLVAARLGLG